MNLLAHAVFLPHGDPLRMTAAVAGDRIRGPLDAPENARLHPSVREGVRLHRALDTLSDTHPALQSAKSLFPEHSRRFAGVAIDLCGDWVLWRHWKSFHPIQPWDFVKQAEKNIAASRFYLPSTCSEWTSRILSLHLLTACTSAQGIRTAGRRVSGRLSQPDGLQAAVEAALQCFNTLEPQILEFFQSARVFQTPT